MTKLEMTRKLKDYNQCLQRYNWNNWKVFASIGDINVEIRRI
jgi:hypothetical protein